MIKSTQKAIKNAFGFVVPAVLIIVLTLVFLPVNKASAVSVVRKDPSRPIAVPELPPSAAPAIARALQKELPDAYQPKKTGSGFAWSNPRHEVRVVFSLDGPEFYYGSSSWAMGLKKIGRIGDLQSVDKPTLANDDGRIVYDRGAVEEWYVNSAWGVEQGFTVHQAPPGQRGQLAIELKIDSDLQLALQNGALVLSDASGASVSRYAGLRVFDAGDSALPAYMSLEDHILRIVVDDRLAQYPVVVDPWIQTAKLIASDGAQGDGLGGSVSIYGDTVVVGAPWDDNAKGTDAGAAYVFTKPASGWSNTTQVAKLMASDGASGDSFGNSVSIHGDTVVVGAVHDSNANGAKAGAAYVFTKPAGSWTQAAKLIASDGALGDRFGDSVSIHGSTIVVGAWGDDNGNGATAGAAYVFTKPAGSWTQAAKLTASDGAADDRFGSNLSIYGSTIVVGAPGDDNDRGAAYIFVNLLTWGDMTETAKLTASDGAANDSFGFSVSIDNDTVVVGAVTDSNANGTYAGAAYVFVEPPAQDPGETGWQYADHETAKLTASDGASYDNFGFSVSIDGDTIVVGAPTGEAEAGAAYVFVKPLNAGWPYANCKPAKLTASGGASRDLFGAEVSINGATIVVGAQGNDNGNGTDAGAAYVFESTMYLYPINCLTQSYLPLAECNILVDFYNEMNGSGWKDRGNWQTVSDPCPNDSLDPPWPGWTGIECKQFQTCTPTNPPVCSPTNRVTRINLYNNALAGSIPSSIGSLEKLEWFSVRSNTVLGTIPPELGNLQNLTHLYMDDNLLKGSIPGKIGSLPNLQYLHLAGNRLSGPIPAQLGDLSSLVYLNIKDNQLSGPLPATLGNLTDMTWLSLAQNQLDGVVPVAVAQAGASAGTCDFTQNTLCIPDSSEYLAIGKDPICGLPLSNNCTNVCGDNILTVSEGCDDGNKMSGDGCSSSCTVEPGWNCVGNPSVCTYIGPGPDVCGDGDVGITEGCDDGNTNSGDGCSSSCTIEPGYSCVGNPSACTPVGPGPDVCGDSNVGVYEECDDGNTTNGDGCSGSCTIEPGWTCGGNPSVCLPLGGPVQECIPDNTTMCLSDGRFKVEVSWLTEQGSTGKGTVVPYGSADSGMFWFFVDYNWEVLVKVLNGCSYNDKFWVFFAATTDQAFKLTVTDTETGIVKTYFNNLKHPADAITDTAAFDTCLVGDYASTANALPDFAEEYSDEILSEEGVLKEEYVLPFQESELCTASDTQLCLNDNRFKVQVDWNSQDGRFGQGHAVPYGSDDSGMFWFFNQDNWELLIKVLDGCGYNNRYWVFFAATTDQEFTVTVTDTLSGEVRQYTNPMKHPADAVTDTSAFETCP